MKELKNGLGRVESILSFQRRLRSFSPSATQIRHHRRETNNSAIRHHHHQDRVRIPIRRQISSSSHIRQRFNLLTIHRIVSHPNRRHIRDFTRIIRHRHRNLYHIILLIYPSWNHCSEITHHPQPQKHQSSVDLCQKQQQNINME